MTNFQTACPSCSGPARTYALRLRLAVLSLLFSLQIGSLVFLTFAIETQVEEPDQVVTGAFGETRPFKWADRPIFHAGDSLAMVGSQVFIVKAMADTEIEIYESHLFRNSPPKRTCRLSGDLARSFERVVWRVWAKGASGKPGSFGWNCTEGDGLHFRQSAGRAEATDYYLGDGDSIDEASHDLLPVLRHCGIEDWGILGVLELPAERATSWGHLKDLLAG